jgi:hypothetical protein
MNTFDAVDMSVLGKYHVRPIYIKMVCDRCGHTFGIHCDENFDGKLTEKNLVCKTCIVEDYLQESK